MDFFKNTFNKIFKKQEEQKPNSSKLEEVDVPQDSLIKIFELSKKFIAEGKQYVSDEAKLQLYGFYKQATLGNCNTQKPAVWQMVAKSKWEAWNTLKGMSPPNAMKNYIAVASKADPSVQKKIIAELQGQEYEQNQHQGCNMHKVETAALKKVEQKDYSQTYSHPYFKPIEKGEPIPQIKKQLLLQINNNPKVYPLHFAIDKQREDLVPQFLAILSVADIQKMKDQQGTGILEYAELIENEVILELVRQKLGK